MGKISCRCGFVLCPLFTQFAVRVVGARLLRDVSLGTGPQQADTAIGHSARVLLRQLTVLQSVATLLENGVWDMTVLTAEGCFSSTAVVIELGE